MLAAALLVATAAVVFGVWLGRKWFGGDGGSTLVRSTPSVIVAVRDLSRIEGAEYRIERVVSLTDKQSRFFGLIEAEDAILLVASGVVTAGVDLSVLRDGDVRTDEKRRSVELTLPSSRVLSTRLDGDRTFVYRRDTDWLAERKESLETRARQEAERTLTDAATQGGIVRRSDESVKRTVESLCRSLGYADVVVTFRDQASGR
jgi:hypothetical protein